MSAMTKTIIFVVILVLGVFMVGCGTVSNQTISDKAVVINGLLRVEGSTLKDSTNQSIKLKGFCLTNGVYTEPSAPPTDTKFILSTADYQTIQEDGANIVRFYIQYSWLNDANANAFFTYMDEQLAMMATSNLKAIISLHYFGVNSSGSFYTGSQATKAQLQHFWKTISDRYVTNNVIAGYDLLNEPYCSDTFREDTLYNIYEGIITEIRTNNDQHVIFISDPVNKYDNPNASATFNLVGADAFKKLSDTNIVYQFHWYKPIKFTHQTVSSNYFQLGADYPYQTVEEENYKDGWYSNTKKATTNTTGWITITSDAVILDGVVDNKEKISPTNKVGLSISMTNTNGIIQIKNIRIQKSTYQSFNSFTEIPIKNQDFSMKRRYDIYNQTFDNRPANWYVLRGNSNNNSAYEITGYYIDNGHLNIDFTGASWIPFDWATLKINWWDGHRNYIDYTYGEGYYYRVIFDINTDITQGEIYAGFEFYDCPTNKTELTNKSWMENAISTYYVNWANSKGVPLYCGEWGVADPSQAISSFPNAPSQQVAWINDMSSILYNKGIHWTYHDYKNYDNLGFGVFDTNARNEIKQALQNAF